MVNGLSYPCLSLFMVVPCGIGIRTDGIERIIFVNNIKDKKKLNSINSFRRPVFSNN